MRPGLPDEIVELLAGDESFAVRLFICERQQDAPGWLLAQTAATWTGRSRWTMLRHKNFPADAAARLARSDNRHDRVGAAAHPGLPADVIEALLTDDDAAVRRRDQPGHSCQPANRAARGRRSRRGQRSRREPGTSRGSDAPAA